MASGRCGGPSRCSSSASARRCVAPSPGSCARGPGSPARTSPRPSPRSTPVPAPRSSVPPGDEATFLATYPSGLLTTDLDVRARLTRFGLRRIGAVAELPRSALIARFGDEGARLHARARGEETEPFRARHAPERLALALPIEPPVEDLEPLRFVLHRLVAAITAQLTARGLAADRAHLTLELDLAFAPRGTSPRIEVEQRFPEPTADPEAVERLLFARLEREPPPAAVQRLDLELRGTTPAAGQQLPLFVPQAARTARLGWQLARLALTYGEDRVRRVAITDPEAPLPEDPLDMAAGRAGGESDRPCRPPRPRTPAVPGRDPPPARAPHDRRRARCRRAPHGDPLERPARSGRGLQSMARRGIVVARADRPRLPQGRRGAMARARLPGPARRDVAPGAPLRLSRAALSGRARSGPDACAGRHPAASGRSPPTGPSRCGRRGSRRPPPTARCRWPGPARRRDAGRQVVDEVVDDRPDARSAQVADHRDIRHEQQQRERPPRQTEDRKPASPAAKVAAPSARNQGRIHVRSAVAARSAAAGRVWWSSSMRPWSATPQLVVGRSPVVMAIVSSLHGYCQ